MFELVGIMFAIVWLVGIVWAITVAIENKNVKFENKVICQMNRRYSEVVNMTLKHEREIMKELEDLKNEKNRESI